MKEKINESIFYHIYPLGLCGAPEENNLFTAPEERLLELVNWIDHLKNMGINAIYLGPVFESLSHGYDTIDYFSTDRRLGSNETLKKLISEFHKNDIKVVLDAVFNHVSRNFFAFEEFKNNNSSNYQYWFEGINFNQTTPYGDNFSYSTWDGHYNLVKLNLKNPEVKEHIFSAVEKWIKEFNIDGLRLDAADVMDREFLSELSAFTKNIKNNFWLMGEMVHGDYNSIAGENMLDSATNYECYKGLYSSHNDKNYFEIAYSLKRLFANDGIYKDLLLYNFADNHDVNRIVSTLENKRDLYPLYGLLFSIPGIPSIYYGSEFGIEGEKTGNSDKNLRPHLSINNIKTDHPDLINAIKRFAECRKNSHALKYGDYSELFVSSQQLVFKRESEEEIALIAVNSNELSCNIHLDNSYHNREIIDILNNESFQLTSGHRDISIPSKWLRILTIKKY